MKLIDNSNLIKRKIFRLRDGKQSRLNFVRLDKNERSNHHEKNLLKLKKNINSDNFSLSRIL